MGRNLPTKEQGIFRAILKFYEHKQYKKALKQCEQILRKYPDHGETLAMKGLILNYLDRKEEAYDYVRKGLRNDLTSHICWHVFGLLHRANKNYEEAIKCYLNALKHDRENIQILRDLSLLQIQMRNMEGFNETRHQLLTIRPQNKASWIGLAVSYHLMDNHDMAIKVLDAYENTLQRKPGDPMDFETSELLLYKNSLLMEACYFDEAIHYLKSIEHEVCDKRAVREAYAEALLKLGRKDEAEKRYRMLLEENNENHVYYYALFTLKGYDTMNELSEEERVVLLNLLKELEYKFPKADAPKRLALEIATGCRFAELIEEYIKKSLEKCIPSVFVNIKSLYKDKTKLKMIDDLIPTLENDESNKDDHLSKKEDNKITTLMFIAQHYDHQGQTMKALEYIEKAIALDNSVVELYLLKAKFFKHGGDTEAAMQLTNKAREMDLADRYLNTKCTKYMIRNDKIQESEATVALFAKGESEGTNNLVELQCMWYALECGDSYHRQKDYGRALKKFHQIEKHFADFVDDQFDFHTYCLRKMTLRAYMRMIKFEDEIYGQDFFVKAAIEAIKCYLELYDDPELGNGKSQDDLFVGLSEAERKKLISKRRRAEAKLKIDEQKGDIQGAKKASSVGDKKDSQRVDENLDGKKYLGADKDYLAEAIKLLKLIREPSNNIEIRILACEIYRRKDKPLAVLSSLSMCYKMDPNRPELHKSAILAYPLLKGYICDEESVQKLIHKALSAIFGEQELCQFNRSFFDRNRLSFKHVLCASQMMLKIDSTKREESFHSILSASLFNSSAYECIAAHRFLRDDMKSLPEADRFKQKAKDRHPLCRYFS